MIINLIFHILIHFIIYFYKIRCQWYVHIFIIFY